MCRALVYLGQPVLIDHLLYQPDSSLVKQSFMPRKLQMLNLAGFGMRAWDQTSHDPELPFTYSSTDLPVFDRNLETMARKIKVNCLLAHARGVSYDTRAIVSNENTHPFCFPSYRLAMAHNGDLARIEEIKPEKLRHIRPEIAAQINGTTDSEWIYALLLSQFAEPTKTQSPERIKDAVEGMLGIIAKIRAENGVSVSSSVNLFIADGESLAVVRYCFDFGRYSTSSGPGSVHEANLSFLSLWYTAGREFGFHEDEWKMIGGSDTADSIIVASEPLTLDSSTWLEVPEYAMLYASTTHGKATIELHHLEV